MYIGFHQLVKKDVYIQNNMDKKNLLNMWLNFVQGTTASELNSEE